MRPGEMLFFYTDGLSEAKNTSGEQFGRKHVQLLINEHSTETAQQLVATMEREVHLHVADAMQSDDITMLVIRWKGHEGETAEIIMDKMPISITMRASMDDISCLEPFIANVTQEAGIEDRETKHLRLAVEEAVANVINHGHATTITLQATIEGNQLILTIDDDGVPFDPTQKSPTDLSIPADERPPGGMGIMLLHEMTEGLRYQRIDGHNILEIIKLK